MVVNVISFSSHFIVTVRNVVGVVKPILFFRYSFCWGILGQNNKIGGNNFEIFSLEFQRASA